MDGVPYGRRLTDLARERAEGAALVVAAADGGEMSYDWLWLEARANQAARLLAGHGVGAGDLVALGLGNTVEHVVVTFAAWKLGAVVLPLRPELPAWERDRLLDLVDPRQLVGDWPDAPTGMLTSSDLQKSGVEDDGPIGGELAPPCGRLIASSGSTGTPKIIVAPSPGRYVPDPQGLLPAGSVVLGASPLYHTNGWTSCFPPLLNGDLVVLVERFDAARAVDLIERYQVTSAILVPTMLQRIARLEGVRERDFSSLQRVVYGGAVLPDWVARIWLELVSPERFWFTYGGSEAVGIVACTGAEWLTHPGTTGRGVDCDVAVLGPDARRLPAGEVGEVWLRLWSGEEQPFRYVGAETPEPAAGGFRTYGDMGRLDEDGYLYIVDRRQDMIVTGGVNVFPAEVETALSDHPEVADVAVIGLPDPEWGRAVHAVVQPRRPDAPPDAEDLRAWCKQRLSGPKVPKGFRFLDQLPRTAAGKINRSQLAAELTDA
jgi:bile acid-coenzyme A ligase